MWVCRFENTLHLGKTVLQVWNPFFFFFFLKEEEDRKQQAESRLLWLISQLKEDLYCRWGSITAAATSLTHMDAHALMAALSPFAPDTQTLEWRSQQDIFPAQML